MGLTLVLGAACDATPPPVPSEPDPGQAFEAVDPQDPQAVLHRLAPGRPGPAQPTLTVQRPEPEPELGDCTRPSTLPLDPLVITQTSPLTQAQYFPVHMLDIEADLEGSVLYVVGMGGLYIMVRQGADFVSASNTLDLWLGEGETEVRSAQFSEVEIITAGWIALTNRDFGLSIVNTSDPANPVVTKSLPLPNAAGMHHEAGLLTVVTHGGELVVYDVTDPANPQERGHLGGLGNPWDVVTVAGYAYVADNTLGLVVVDLRDPTQPILRGALETVGGAQDIDTDGQHLYVAAGSAGLEVFDAKVAGQPQTLSLLDYGGAVISVSVSEGRVWGATLEGVFVADVRDPAHPRPLTRQRTDEFAMAVHAVGTVAYVADWSRMVRMELDPNRAAPSADPEREEIVFLDPPNPTGAAQTLSMVITNRGADTLRIVGASLPDPRFDFAFEHTRIAAGSSAQLTINFFNDGGEVDTSLCLATNDPDAPLRHIVLRSSPTARTSAGEFAPDFVLPSVQSDEVTYRLSDQLGKPVLLVYFAMW